MGLGASIERLDYDDLKPEFLSSLVVYVKGMIYALLQCLNYLKAGFMEHTFFPAYLPRVMIATRPTLRTTKTYQWLAQRHDKLKISFLHFIVDFSVVEVVVSSAVVNFVADF